jgi:hypothetical protein
MKNAMKSKFLLIIITLIFTFSVLAESKESQKGKWKGKVTQENGVTVIENRGSGLFGEDIQEKITFKEILSIGVDEGPDHLIFGRHIMIDVDSSQSIYALDVQNHRLLKFDRNGHFQWQAGRDGQGPGEIESPHDIKIIDDGSVIIADHGGKFHFFDKNGSFQKMIRLEKVIKSIISSSKGEIFANLWIKGQPGISAALFSKEGNLIHYFPVEYRYGPKLSPRRAYSLGGGFSLFGDRLFLSLPDKYEIREYTLDGKLLKMIRRDVKIRPPSLKEGYRFVINDISGPCFLTSEGILINKLEFIADNEKFTFKTFLDFFNENFEFLGSYPHPEDTYLSQIDPQDNFYFIQIDPFIKIIKYALKINENKT